MELLETRLEALVFTYSATAASSLWTWLAFLTATAVGYWRIRSVASKSDAPPALPPPKSAEPQHQLRDDPPATIPAESAPAVPCWRSVSCAVERSPVECRTKGTFFEVRVCHVEDDGGWGGWGGEELPEEENAWEEGDGAGHGIYGGFRGLLWVGWEGDLGWYRCQDMTALNGNVVRLWDDDRRLHRRRSV